MRNEEKAHRMHTTIETDTDKEALCDRGKVETKMLQSKHRNCM